MAALILYDDSAPVTDDNISKLIEVKDPNRFLYKECNILSPNRHLINLKQHDDHEHHADDTLL